MRKSPYTFDILNFLHYLKVHFEETTIIIYYDKNLLHRGDQHWINNDNQPHLLKNIIIDSLILYGFKSFHIVNSEFFLEKCIDIYGDQVVHYEALFPKEIKVKIHTHYSFYLFFKNPSSISFNVCESESNNFYKWIECHNIKKYVLIQIREKNNDIKSYIKNSEIEYTQSIINLFKKTGYSVIILPDYHNRYVEFYNAITYPEGSTSVFSRVPVYSNASLNISIDQVGPFAIAMQIKNPSLVIHTNGSKLLPVYKKFNYAPEGSKVNKPISICEKKKLLFLHEREDLAIESALIKSMLE